MREEAKLIAVTSDLPAHFRYEFRSQGSYKLLWTRLRA